MDDHMLDRLLEEINLCFQCADMENKEGQDIRENYQYKSATVLIKAYNALVRLYYKPEYVKNELLANVDRQYKIYKAAN